MFNNKHLFCTFLLNKICNGYSNIIGIYKQFKDMINK